MTQSSCVAECYAHIQRLQQELSETAESLSRLVSTDSAASITLEQLPERISVLKVAELLSVKPATVRKQWANYGLIRSGRGRHGRTFYRTDSVLRFLNRRHNGGF